MFKEEIIKEENTLKIKVFATNIRKYSHQNKEVYRKDIKLLIPEDIRGQVKLISAPSKMISNYKDENFTQSGVWVYEIIKEKPSSPIETKQQPQRKRRTVRKPTTRKKTTTEKQS